MNLQQLLTIAMPLICSLLGSSLSGILAQDGFPEWANGLIAWLVLILASIGSAYAAHGLNGSLDGFLHAVIAAATLLLSGGLSSLKPWLLWLDFLQSHVFNVVKPTIVASDPYVTAKRPVVKAPQPIQLGTNAYTPPTNGNHGGG